MFELSVRYAHPLPESTTGGTEEDVTYLALIHICAYLLRPSGHIGIIT